MRVVIYGGRDFIGADFAFQALDRLHEIYKFSVVISGRAKGADMIGEQWAKARGIPVDPYPVTKDDYAMFGRYHAPKQRNQRMIDQGRPDMGVEFPGAGGTTDMRARMAEARIPVERCRP